MKKLALLVVASVALAAPAKKSLYDHYLEMPLDLVGLTDPLGKPFDAAAKKNLVKLRDDKNGYLELDGKKIGATEADPTFALFLDKQKEPIIAVSTMLGDSSALRFYRRNGEQWTDVTEQVLPIIDDTFLNKVTRKIYPTFPKERNFSDFAGAIVKYTLPRKGTTIVATSLYEDEKVFGKKIFELTWDGEKFTAR